jgi:hypothetical protein
MTRISLPSIILGLACCLSAGEPSDPGQRYVGIGLPAPSYFDGMYWFTDVVKCAGFRTADWGEIHNGSGADALGWPTQDFILIISANRIAGGTYPLRFRGQAAVSLGGTGGSVSAITYDAGTNTSSGSVTITAAEATGNVWLTFTGTRRTAGSAAGSGITDIRLIRPGYPVDGSKPFTDEFLQAAGTYHVVRSMDFTKTNTNPERTWADRRLPAAGATKHLPDPGGGSATFDLGGTWEDLVAMANASDTDLWICIPPRADDAYMTSLANLLRYGSDGVNPYTAAQASPVHPPLAAHLKIYVEVGNELWNFAPGFYGQRWLKVESDAARVQAAPSRHPINVDGSVTTSEWGAFQRFVAWRSAVASLRFRAVFGDAAMMTRVRPVFASQVRNGNAYLSEGLRWAERFYGQTGHPDVAPALNNTQVRTPAQLWYGAGGAAYYDSTAIPTWKQTDPTYGYASLVPATMEAYFQGMPSAAFTTDRATDSLWTAAFGLRMVCYEGGPGHGGNALGGIDAFEQEIVAYNQSERNVATMQNPQRIWDEHGGGLFVYYNAGMGNGAWDFGNFASHRGFAADNPKQRAIAQIVAEPKAALAFGRTVPAAIAVAGATDILTTESFYAPPGGDMVELRIANSGAPYTNGTVTVPVRVTTPGTYKARLVYRATQATSAELLAGGVRVGTFTLPASAVIADSASLSLTLPVGLTGLRVRPTGAGAVQLVRLDVIDATTVETPVFSLPAGSYTTDQTVSISTETPQAVIHYTLDGSTPTTLSPVYSGPLTIGTTTTLRAIAVRPGWTTSLLRSATYDLSGNINAGGLLTWNFSGSGLTNGLSATAASTFRRTGVQAATLVRGAGFPARSVDFFNDCGAIASGADSTGAGPTATTLAGAKTNGAYLQFTIAPAPGYRLVMSELRLAPWQQATTTTPTVTVEYSLDGFATAGIGLGSVTTGSSAWDGTPRSIALGGVAALQQATGPVTIRLWFHAFGQWQALGLGQISGDNVDLGIFGSVTPVAANTAPAITTGPVATPAAVSLP